MEKEIKELRKEIDAIKTRNARAEPDKDWETSKTRTAFIALITFGLLYGFLRFNNQPRAFLNSLIGVLAYYLSTESYGILQKWWLKNRKV